MEQEVWCSGQCAGAFLGLLSDARNLYELRFIVIFESFAMLWPAWRELRCGAGPGPPQVQADGLLTVQGQPCEEGIQELQGDVVAQLNPQDAKPDTCTMCDKGFECGLDVDPPGTAQHEKATGAVGVARDFLAPHTSPSTKGCTQEDNTCQLLRLDVLWGAANAIFILASHTALSQWLVLVPSVTLETLA